jgi:putative lipoprotein
MPLVVNVIALIIVATSTIVAQDLHTIGTVSGTITYSEGKILPDDTEIVIELVDITKDTPTGTLATQTILSHGRQIPFSFALNYDTGSISEYASYGIIATIYTGSGSNTWTNETPRLVISNGEFTADVIVTLVPPSPSDVETPDPTADDAVALVQEVIKALYTGGDLTHLFCSALSEEADAYREAASASTAAFEGAQIDVSHLTYTVTSAREDRVTVEVEGEVVYTISGVSSSFPLPALSMHVVNENGGWKLCI